MAGEDRAYIRWLGGGRCIVPGCRKMSGPPHHVRHDVGMGMRAHDHRAVPLCPEHHEDAQQYRGVFGKMGRQGMREFFDDAAERLRTQYLEQGVTNDENSEFPR